MDADNLSQQVFFESGGVKCIASEAFVSSCGKPSHSNAEKRDVISSRLPIKQYEDYMFPEFFCAVRL